MIYNIFLRNTPITSQKYFMIPLELWNDAFTRKTYCGVTNKKITFVFHYEDGTYEWIYDENEIRKHKFFKLNLYDEMMVYIPICFLSAFDI